MKTVESILFITPGDPKGIGPEVTVKALKKITKSSALKNTCFVCIGAFKPFKNLSLKFKTLTLNDLDDLSSLKKNSVYFLPAPEKQKEGYQVGWSIKTAVDLVRKNKSTALVTGPISKKKLQDGGFQYSGHTEFLADLAGLPAQQVTMMLANSSLRVSLVTTHLSLKSVSDSISVSNITRATAQTIQALQRLWKISYPKIAILSLNPHAGENGLFGDEEDRTITPALTQLKTRFQRKARINGPFPADTFFAKNIENPPQKRFDAVIAMYHDQGLIPIKLLDFSHTINITLGLPFIRTSVDHGVGFDIAGKNRADSSSMEQAILEAGRFLAVNHKRRR